MNKTRVRWIHLAALCLTVILIVSGGPSSARAGDGTPAEMLERAWQNARESGSYRFISDIKQTLLPRPVPSMIGQQGTVLTLALDGAVILPGQGYTEMKVHGGQSSEPVVMLRDGQQSFMLQDGRLVPVEDVLNLVSQGNDVLGYLAAAEEVTLLDPPEGHPELVRYAFAIDGPRYAEYVRRQAEDSLRAEPGAPEGLAVKPLPMLQQLSGQGELWVDRAGLPVRQVLELELPEVNDSYGAQIRLSADFSSYGQVASLPQAVQGPDGSWHLDGSLVSGAGPSLGEFPGFVAQSSQAEPGEPRSPAVLPDWRARLVSLLPERVSPGSIVLFVLVLLVVSFIRLYRRRPRRCYALVVCLLIPIFIFSPLLESIGSVKFVERRARAAAANAAAVPELLQGLGLQAVSTAPDSASTSSKAGEDPNQSQAIDSAPLTAEAALQLAAANKPEGAPLYDGVVQVPAGQGQEALEACGYGEPGVDTDGDGLDDQVEYCLGTVSTNPDSDYDSITDKMELEGFVLGGQHWDSDPLNADSNRDGHADTLEWSSQLAPKGQAVDADLDGDGVPNLWDDDDDGDQVPDSVDLSPSALTDYTTEFSLNTQGILSSGTQAIEIEVQPQEMDHLRYSTTLLDWPLDEEGNIRDLDDSTGDLRLTPFLLVTTNVQPDEELLEQYGVRAWYDEEQGKTVLMVTLQPLEDGGAIYAFYGKVAYTYDQTGDIQWDARLVWMAQMQLDTNVCHQDYYLGQVCEVETQPSILHQYQETFRITGLQVTKSESYEATVMGTPGMAYDDRYLFQMLVGMNNTYQSFQTLEGQDVQNGETALQEIYSRFTTGDTITHTFGVPSDIAAVAEPKNYRNAEEGLADMSSQVLPAFLDATPSYASAPLCRDAGDNPVTCASLILAGEAHSGVLDLSELRGDHPRMVSLDRLSVNLAGIPVFAMRSTNLRMYEMDPATGLWHTMMPARMLEMVEARYHDAYPDTLQELYPDLRVQDARFIAYTGYLWAYGGQLTTLSVDGQALVPELADEQAAALAAAVQEDLVHNGIDYIGLASNLPSILSDTFSTGQGIYEIVEIALEHAKMSKLAIGGKATLSVFGIAAATASLIMNCINTACAANEDLKVCGNETALMIANILVGSYVITMQVIAITIQIVTAIVDKLAIAVKNMSASAIILGWIGAGIGIAMTWVSFGIIAGTTQGDPVAWRMALGMAIVTTVWLVVLACLNFIPVIGPIISAIISAIDYIIGLFTGLFAKKQWSLAQILFELFYMAETRTSVESAAFGDFSSALVNPELGLIEGNTFKLSVPAGGVITAVNRGGSEDLEESYVKGELQPEQDPDDPQPDPFAGEAMNEAEVCPNDGEVANCSNTAAVGYSLVPRINGSATFVARILYQSIWKEYIFEGAVQVNTHYTTGQFPEEDTYNTLFLDVLPASLTDLWGWSELDNPDRDGDGLTNEEEAPLGTDPDLWDTDGDGLSDKYEWETGSARGTDPLDPDSDDDGLQDALERRVGSRINQADSDGDGLTDGEELRHLENGSLVGGWQITPLDTYQSSPVNFSSMTPTTTHNISMRSEFALQAAGETFWVSSHPLSRDDDGDSLNASEERLNGISPQARNALVPGLQLSVSPIGEIPDARPGAFWLPGTGVEISIDLANIAYAPVNSTLSLTLPPWLDTVGGGLVQGDRRPPMEQDGSTLTWAFTGSNVLQRYEAVSTTVTARVNPGVASARDEITLDLPYGDVQMHKLFQAVVDGDDPLVSIMAPGDGSYLRGTSFVVGGSAADRTTWITQRSLSIDPGGIAVDLHAGQGAWAYTWQLPESGGDGVYTLQAQATDAMNHTAFTGEVVVTVDNTLPAVTLASEMVAGAVHLSGTAQDNLAGVEWVQLMIDGQPWRSVPLNGSDWSYDWMVSESAQGEHTVSVRAIDRSRNQSEVVSQTILVDGIAPASIVNAGADKDVPPAVLANETFVLSGVADEGGHLPLPAAPAELAAGMDVFDDSAVWLGVSSIHENDGGVVAAWIGDFNADRLSDLAVGLPGPEGDAGSVGILYGRAGGWPVPPDLEMLAAGRTRFTGVSGARLGSFVVAPGDVNADSRDDLLIGGRSAEQAFLVFGNPGPLGSVTLESGQSGYRTLLQAPAPIEGMAAAGDVDGDGRADLLISSGGSAYLLLGRGNPWPERIDLASEAVERFPAVNGALGIGDIDNDQRAEWVTLAEGLVTVYGWDASAGTVELVTTLVTSDAEPRAIAPGDVDGDEYADWLYSDGASRILVYGSGGTHTFTGYDGFMAAPGDVDGDGRADILLADSAGVASLVGQPEDGSPTVFATVDGVGGAAGAPYAAGADLNSDGSADLLLIPGEAAAQEKGFDAPDFSSGFISPQSLPFGASTQTEGEETSLAIVRSMDSPFAHFLGMEEFGLLTTTGSDTRYVDDDGVCDGNTPCYTTIQAAVNASDGGGDAITVYPGAYPAFNVPAGASYDHLRVEGVSADAVFVEGGAGNAISIAAGGVHLSNLTVRNATSGVRLEAGAGEPTWAGGEETVIDHLLAHSVRYPLDISQSAVVTVADSTLVGNGVDPILRVDPALNSAVHTWHTDRAVGSAITLNGGLAGTGGSLYAMAGGADPVVYTAAPGEDGALGAWTPAFRVPENMPYTGGSVKRNVVAAGGGYFYQMHPSNGLPDFGGFNGLVRAVALAPDGDIYVGGAFTLINNTVPANHIARWDGAQWHALGTASSNGVDGPVYALTILSNGDVYAGGDFDRAFASTVVPAHNIARWSDSQWLTLGESVVNGNGTDGPVYALAHTDDGVVAVGGNFEYVRVSLAGYTAGQAEEVRSFALYNPVRWPDTAGWFWDGYRMRVGLWDNNGYHAGTVRSLAWSGGNYLSVNSRFILGGSFEDVGSVPYTAHNIAEFVYLGPMYGQYHRMLPLGGGVNVSVSEAAIHRATGDVYAVSDDPSSLGVYWYDRSELAWGEKYGMTGPASALEVDARGILYVGMLNGDFLVDQPAKSPRFETLISQGPQIWDILTTSLLPERTGQVLLAQGDTASSRGGIRYWELEGLLRYNLSAGNWQRFNYPGGLSMNLLPTALAADDSGNLYVASRFNERYEVYRFNGSSRIWETRARLAYINQDPAHTLTDLVWAGGYLYGLAHSAQGEWYLYRHDPAGPSLPSNSTGPMDGWTPMGLAQLPSGAGTAGSRSLAWDGMDSIYVLQASGMYRYRIGANAWDLLGSPSIAFTLAQKPVLARAGNNLYAYAAPGANVTTNLFRYGAVGMPDLRLTLERTALVEPDSASSFAWTNLSSPGGTYRFQIQAGATNTWIGPSTAGWSPALPAGASRLTSAQADFVAAGDGLYRLDAGSLLTAGYHRYKAVAHVYTSQAACVDCANGSLVWGETAFATIREAVESGAARVLVHPGRYPQTFYLVSGVEVIGSGAESTILEPPASPAATLVTAEGVSGASLARLTLAGGALWDGFLAEGGATGLRLARLVLRGLKTGVRLSGDAQVEIVNNTLVGNTDGILIEGESTPVNVRNTILAYNSGTGLSFGANPTTLSNIYNDFWSNGTHMLPADQVTLGSLFLDPRFRSLGQDDLRLAANSPLIDMGAPHDPTTPGGGERVDIGYAEFNGAGFYVSQDYSETGLNDGLTWGVDAFDQIQGALDAAAAALHGLPGAPGEGGYSVAVDAGTYNERITLPSHVRLVGSGAEATTLDAGDTGSAVTLDGVIDSELSGFTVQNAGGAGVELKGASSGITIARSVIRGSASHGVSLAESSSAELVFNTIVDNGGAGVYANGAGAWAQVYNNIVSANAAGLQAESGGLLRNGYNLLDNPTNLSGVAAGAGTVEADPSFAGTGHYIPGDDSPAVDAADPQAAVPLAGGLRADLGYKELIASPLTLVFGPQVASSVTGNSGIDRVELGVVQVSDPALPVTATLPSTWQVLTPAQNDLPLFYWSQALSESAPGLYRVYSRAADAAGNLETDEEDWYEGAFVVDSTAPTLTWGEPTLPGSTSAAAVLATAEAVGTLTSAAGARDDLVQLYFSVTGPAGTTSYPAEGGQAWIPLPAAGSYTIDAVAEDEAGNRSSQRATVGVAAGSPVATVTNYTMDGSVNRTALTLRGYVRFASAGAGELAVSVDGGAAVQAVLDAPGAAFSAWSAEITLPGAEGVKTISLAPSLDGAAGAVTTLDLALDTTAPALTVAGPAAGSTVIQSVTFSGTASDTGAGLARVEVSLGGGYLWREAVLNGGAWSLDWEMDPYQDYVSYPAQVRAIDAAGNVTLVEHRVVVDNLPPTGLDPVTFSRPVGQHLDKDASLAIAWNAPVDAGGFTQVLAAVDQQKDTLPDAAVSGENLTAGLDAVGDWYVHLLAQDGAGNQTLLHYGPWHVRDLAAVVFGDRRESIVLDGFLDLEHDEWQATDLLGIDARSWNPQELYLSADGLNVFLGWSGAWWTLDGVLWAYLDLAPGGSTATVDNQPLPGGLAADQAVEIRRPGEGILWTWDGAAWTSEEGWSGFANDSSGDTEVRLPWSPSGDHPLNLIAFALPREAEELAAARAETLTPAKVLASRVGESLATAAPAAARQGPALIAPWAIFPTTNALDGPLTQGFAWSPEDLDDLAAINRDQPAARTVVMTVTSPQASGAVHCPGQEIVYDILLENPEPTAFSDLTLTLDATGGLSYLAVEGAALAPETTGSTHWVLEVPTLAAGSQAHVLVRAGTTSGLGGLAQVASDVTLSSGASPLTTESQARATISHRVDGQAPAVSIHAPNGSAIAAGVQAFTGAASDGVPGGDAGSGVKLVEVSIDGGSTWQPAVGTLDWSIPLSVPDGAAQLTLQARAVDSCGYLGDVVANTFTVDTAPPEVIWTAPGVVTGSLFELSGVVSDPAPAGSLVQRVEVQLDDEAGAWHLAAGPFPPQNGVQGWQWSWSGPMEDGVTHRLRVRAADGVGNTTVTPWQETIVDVVAPQVTVTQPVTGLVLPFDPPQGPVLGGTATDGSGLQGVQVLVYGPQGFVSTQPAVVAGDAWAYTPDVTGWVAGTYALRVQAVDAHGSLRMVGPYQIVVTDTPVAGLAAANDGPRRVDEPVTFTATITAGSSVTYTWDFGDGATATGPSAAHAYAAAGEYTATVTASNSSSTLSAATVVNILDLSVEAGAGQEAFEGRPVTVSASFVDGRAGVTHSATLDWGDGVTTDGAVDEQAATITGAHAYADNGAYTLTVTVHNSLGQTSSDTLQVVVSNLAPSAVLVNDGPQPEAGEVTVSFNDVLEPGAADTLTYSFDWDNNGVYEIVDQPGASATYTWPDDGTYTVQARIEDDDGASNVYTTLVEVTNVVPAVDAGQDLALAEGSVFTGSGSFVDPGDDTWEATVDYGDGSGVAPLALSGKSFDLAHRYAGDGSYDLTVCVTDDGVDRGCDTARITVENLAPAVTAAPGYQDVPYSEAIAEITFTAADVPADTLSAVLSWSSDGVTFQTDPPFAGLSLSDGSCTEAGGVSTCTWKVSGNVGMPAGSYTLRLAVADEDGGSAVADVALTVEPEEAVVTFDAANSVAVPVSGAGGSSVPFDLRVCVSERDVPLPGDISLARVSMSLAPVGPGGQVDGAPGAPTVENGLQCVPFSFNEVPVNTYTLRVEVDGGYYAGAGEDVLVIYDPSLGFTTGGGWFYWPGTADAETGYPGDRTNFGYTMKYNKKGTNIQGGLLLIRHLADGTLYRVKSNALYGLALGEDARVPLGWASFGGKSTYQEPGWPEPTGNYEFLAYVEDRNEPGEGGDRFWIEVLGGLALPGPAADYAAALEGGNLVVPHQAR